MTERKGTVNGAATGAPKAPAVAGHVSRGRASAVLMIGVFALAFSGILVKESNFEPATNAWLRIAIGLLTLLPFGFFEMKKKGRIDAWGMKFSLLAGCFLGVDFVCWNYSIFYVGAGIASILLNLQVIIVPMLAWAFDKYRVPVSFIILVPLMIVGIMLTGGVFEPADTTGPATVYGIKTAVLGTALGCTSGVCYSFYLYFSRKAGKHRRDLYSQSMIFTNITQLIPSSIFILCNFSGRGFDLTHGVMLDGKLPAVPETMVGDDITAHNWFMMILLGTLAQAMAWTFVQYGSVHIDPTLAAGLLLLSPASTIFIAAGTHGEIPSVLQVVGVIVILACVAWQNGLIQAAYGKITGKKPKPPVESEVTV
ncbi:DMT family transporter [Corynebacterium caspium]|uniref:DMT family transporter n=1 Tax=Corynebacterium caspium TaxID=234828 RepID=UPI0012E99C82|nr:DMT family transporter [Corynebacterium caspium]WKD58620.1 EamA-like transporter family protein [Corynebacterium caspium DSM 44850]